MTKVAPSPAMAPDWAATDVAKQKARTMPKKPKNTQTAHAHKHTHKHTHTHTHTMVKSSSPHCSSQEHWR